METVVEKKKIAIEPKVITREVLKDKVKEAVALPNVKNGTVFIAGVTKVKDHNGVHQMMLEVVQKKQLNATAKVNILAALNAGDDRFRANARTLRVWLKITEKGFDDIFNSVNITGKELHEKTKDLQKGEVLMTFARIPFINVEGEEQIPTIAVKQYSAENGLPNSIQKVLDIAEEERSEDQDAFLKGLEMRTNDDEALVDEYGNQVYEMNSLTYGEEENILIRKMPISEYLKAQKDNKKRNPAPSSEEIKNDFSGLTE